MQRYIKNPNLRKEKRYFFFIAAPMRLFFGETQAARPEPTVTDA